MKYSTDLGKLGLDEYLEIIRCQDLLPGRKALHLNLDSNFSLIKEAGIKNLGELLKAISTAPKLKCFSEKAGISEDYLVLLKREAGTLEPKAVNLKDFPGIDVTITDSLFQSGIKTSKDFYELFNTDNDSGRVSKELAISESMAHELYCLCSLARINGIGASAAKCFFEAGFLSVSDIAETSAEEMLFRVSRINIEKQYYKAKLGTKDIQFCIDYANILNRLGE